MSTLDLPASVLGKVERAPVEDLVLYALREGLPDMPVFSLIPEDPPPNGFILVRRDDPFGAARIDEHVLGYGYAYLNAFTVDPDGDEKGALLLEACRVVLRDAWESKLYVPNCGWITRVRQEQAPSRVTDWATSTGPVQYADLPTGYWRYEAKYSIKWRRDLSNPFIS